MAFVSQSDRKLTSLKKNPYNIGPGHYQTIDLYKLGKTVPSVAPFNSSAVKRTIYDQQKIKETLSSLKIGPGAYHVNHSFVQQNIKTYVNENSVIVKINSFETSQFKSSVPRFQSLQTQIPGPGSYSHDQKTVTFSQSMKKKSIEKRKLMKEKLHQFVTQLKKSRKISSKPSIPSRNSNFYKTTQNFQGNKGKTEIVRSISDLTKNLNQQNNSKNEKGFTWTKAQRKIFPNEKSNLTERNLGPGKYFKTQKIDQNQKLSKLIPPNNKFMKKRSKTQSSAFETKYVRTFFDELYYETNSKEKATIRQEQNFKTNKPGPGYYELDNGISKKIKSEKTNVAFQFFGSTVERFSPQKNEDTDSESNSKLFSCYDRQRCLQNTIDSNYIGNSKSFNKKNQGFLSTDKKRIELIQQNKDTPGPGQYEINHVKSLFKPKKGKIVQNFGFSDERFPKKNSKQQFFEEINDEKKQFPVKKINQSFMFKSKVNKSGSYMKSQQDESIPIYNITQNDLGTKMRKQTMLIQNLRKIDVYVPAFNSSKPRFSYDQYSKSMDNMNSNERSPHEENQKKIFINTKKSIVREKLIQINKEEVMKCRKSTIYNELCKNDRFGDLQLKQKRANPGVGEYSLRSNWMKQSYNVKYQKKNIKTQSISINDYQKLQSNLTIGK